MSIKTLLLTTAIAMLTGNISAQEDEEGAKVQVNKKYQAEIRSLSEKPVIKSAFRIIMDLEPQTHNDLITLNEIPAPPFKEDKRAAKFIEMMRTIGADSIWTDKAGNVLALVKGKSGKKTVMLEAHLDTVFPEGTDVTVKKSGDTLRAPGIGDDTRGLAVLLAVMKAMKQANIKTDADIVFGGIVGEEGLGDLRGVKQIFKDNHPKIDSYISIDGGGIGAITSGGTGSHRYRVTFKGPGGHSYGAFGLVNPHNATARAIHYFIQEADKFTKEGAKTTYNVGVTGGGTSVNAIPFESWMEVDMRSESPERLTGIDTLFQQAIRKALAEENTMKRRGSDLKVDVKMVGDRPTGVQSPTLPLVQRSMASAVLLGAAPSLNMSSTDSNIPISKGVPAVTIGRGGVGGGAHSLDEWWVNDKGYLAIQNTLLILVAEAGLAK
ncbi:MAG: M20/M25/M40 family metallo-hydrolase [Flavitalea sp.]